MKFFAVDWDLWWIGSTPSHKTLGSRLNQLSCWFNPLTLPPPGNRATWVKTTDGCAPVPTGLPGASNPVSRPHGTATAGRSDSWP